MMLYTCFARGIYYLVEQSGSSVFVKTPNFKVAQEVTGHTKTILGNMSVHVRCDFACQHLGNVAL